MNPTLSNNDPTETDPPVRIGYQNGQWLGSDQIRLSLQDAAVVYAATAVERMRTYRGRFFQIDRHLDRWERTTAALLVDGLPGRDAIVALLEELIRRNEDWIAGHPEYGAVLLASPGHDATPSLIADLYAIDSDSIDRRLRRGMPLVVTDVQQPPEASWPRNIKVRCRLHYYLADQRARRSDPEAIGVLVDADGSVTETSIANLLIVRDGRIISPPDDQILVGVSLQVVRELAERAGLSWQQRRIDAQELRAADEVLLTGTSCGLWFARSIDGSPDRQPGPIYRQLRDRFEGFAGLR